MSTIVLTLRLTIYIITGYLVVKTGIVSKDFSKQLSSLMLTICLPSLILRSFYNTTMDENTLTEFGSVFIATVVTFAVLFVVGYIAKRLSRNRVEGKVAIYGMLTTNFTFFGMPLIESLFGDAGLFYFTILTTLARIVYYGLPTYLLGEGCHGSMREFWCQLVSPVMLSVFAGLILYFAQLKPPEVIASVIQGFASTSTPLGLMLCGMTLAQSNAREALSRPAAFIMTLARLIICPALVLLACTLCGFKPLITEIAVIYSAMPFGALLPTFATKYCTDEHGALYSSTLVFLSTSFCIITIPIWIMVFNTFL
ncbi:MAG: AEC family transporter [Oscillospiraceae bacterium]